MKIVDTKAELAVVIGQLRAKGLSIGLVPTMGALHNGHLSLVKQSRQKADVTVVSIFVNPTQFDNKEDLQNYPRPIDQDILQLEQNGCDVLFMPEVAEMYETGESWDYEVGDLDSKLEGEFRPGHYKGVTQIVYKLFDAVKPDMAFFGQKDYQQYLVINKMVRDFSLPVNLVLCNIVREPDGLAMSSRNVRLNAEERKTSVVLYEALLFIKQHFYEYTFAELQHKAEQLFDTNPLLQLEYIKICDLNTLEEINTKEAKNLIVLVACYVGNVRLIDNMILS
ncbi:pantoate--beta-alanine ligase [Pseudopedobacter beijingensis]|uniref:Pantothenate synthetase n=1 Tax=Pseudopedobacter beijingensis TaxID=1207056 RepID=A0ABW4IA95_9SPHI